MRLNKYIAETGICSRREADAWIAAGRVSVNGAVATLGTQVKAGDAVCVDGAPVGSKSKRVYIALNKPVGITCTTEAHIAGNIVDFVGHRERIFPVGRLDKDSEGLILLTSDGDIVNEILRAENRHQKEYIVTVDRPLTPAFIQGMSDGVEILDTRTLPCIVTAIGRNTFRIVLTQGLNRQIRRMCEVFGYTVRRLQRVRIVNIELGSLPVGRWRDLSEAELRGLLPQRFGTAPRARLTLQPAATPATAPRSPRGPGAGTAGRRRD